MHASVDRTGDSVKGQRVVPGVRTKRTSAASVNGQRVVLGARKKRNAAVWKVVSHTRSAKCKYEYVLVDAHSNRLVVHSHQEALAKVGVAYHSYYAVHIKPYIHNYIV